MHHDERLCELLLWLFLWGIFVEVSWVQKLASVLPWLDFRQSGECLSVNTETASIVGFYHRLSLPWISWAPHLHNTALTKTSGEWTVADFQKKKVKIKLEFCGNKILRMLESEEIQVLRPLLSNEIIWSNIARWWRLCLKMHRIKLFFTLPSCASPVFFIHTTWK